MSTATFTPARHRAYRVSRRRVQPAEALSPARGITLAIVISFVFWACLVFFIL